MGVGLLDQSIRRNHCRACGAEITDSAQACAHCYASEESFPWSHVGQPVVIGAAADPRWQCIVIGCGTDEHSGIFRIGCVRGFRHIVPEEDFITSCDDGVSRAHASIVPQPNGTFLVTNLSQTNHTRVDLDMVPPQGILAVPGQRVCIGQWDFVLGADWPPRGFRRGTWRLPLARLTVKAHGKPIIDDVSLAVERAELLGLLGPSGAGKTTLLYALARIKTAAGSPLDSADLLKFWGSLGYVPQDDIIHADLTVSQALRYACRLRLPAGTPAEKIDERVAWAVGEVGLHGKEHTRIGNADEKTLSGGERRRVSLAAALVTRPKILILDEPTSGLSWTDATKVLDCLRRLAENRSGPGRTIIVTIHQPDVKEFEKFHQVAILAKTARSKTGARLVYFGPPAASYGFFGARVARPPDIFGCIDGPNIDIDPIADRYRASYLQKLFVETRLQKALSHEAMERRNPPRRPSALHQFATLFSRLCRLRITQWRGVVLLFAVALALGGLARLGKGDLKYQLPTFGCDLENRSSTDECSTEEVKKVACGAPIAIAAPGPGPSDRDPASAPAAAPEPPVQQIPETRFGLLSMLMAVFLPLLVVSSGALVSERAIFRNESIAGVRTGPYLLARFFELLIVGSMFMAIVVAIALQGLDVAESRLTFLEIGVSVVSGAVSLGLLISALVPRAELALWAVNLIAVPQILFAGAHARLRGVPELLSHLTVTRPALEAMVKMDLHARSEVLPCQIKRYLRIWPGYTQTLSHPLRDLLVTLAPFAAACLIAAYAALRFRSWRERRF